MCWVCLTEESSWSCWRIEESQTLTQEFDFVRWGSFEWDRLDYTFGHAAVAAAVVVVGDLLSLTSGVTCDI